MEAARVDPPDAADNDRGLRGGSQHERVELLAPGLGVLLGVVQARQRAPVRQRELLEVEEDGGCDERPRETATPGLVSTRDVAAVERAVVGEQAAARTGRTPLRACRFCSGAST
jgi:hypothetical protein